MGRVLLLQSLQWPQKHRSHIFIHRGPASSNVPGETPEVGKTNPYFGLAVSNGPNERPKPVQGDDVIARARPDQQHPSCSRRYHTGSDRFSRSISRCDVADCDDGWLDHLCCRANTVFAGGCGFARYHPKASASLLRYWSVRTCSAQHRVCRKKSSAQKRILFGSDYGPQNSIVPYVEAVEHAELTASQRDRIFTENARLIFEKP